VTASEPPVPLGRPPAPKTVVPADVLASQDWATATIIDHVAARDQHKPIHERATYRAHQGVTILRGPRKKDPPVTVRTVFIWSSVRPVNPSKPMCGRQA
jgi:hypothetical protein